MNFHFFLEIFGDFVIFLKNGGFFMFFRVFGDFGHLRVETSKSDKMIVL